MVIPLAVAITAQPIDNSYKFCWPNKNTNICYIKRLSTRFRLRRRIGLELGLQSDWTWNSDRTWTWNTIGHIAD